mgnify:CR=1 FL=1
MENLDVQIGQQESAIRFILVASRQLERSPGHSSRSAGVDVLEITGHGSSQLGVWLVARHRAWSRTHLGAQKIIEEYEAAKGE